MVLFTDTIVNDLIVLAVTALVVTIAYFKWKFTFWSKLGVPSLSPSIPFGDTKDVFLARSTFGEQFKEFYKIFKEKGFKYGGAYMGVRPFFVVVDPELVKNIMQKDFQHFVNHGGYINEEDDPLSGHLFNLEDAKWRNLRIKLTPTFTSGKMKMMFQTLADCTVGLKDIMNSSAASKAPVDIKEILGCFTTDIIGSAAFGLECNSLKNPDAEFRKYGRKNFEIETWRDRARLIAAFALPHSILKLLKFKFTKSDVEQFFMKAVRDTVNYREKNNIYRKDFMHLLLQLKNRGTVTDDDKITDEHGKIQEKALTMNELTAQAFVFFLAGFETSSTLMTFTLLELATNLDVQDKLRKEINQVMAKHNDQLTYDAMMDMTYMENVLHETLRKYPPVSLLTRQCTQDYAVPNSNVHLHKGVDVGIPILALHTDPEYYPDPEKFDPDRFTEENKNSRPPFTWIPFGEGPRICIGLRFGMLQSKVGITTLLRNYRVTLNKKTKTPIVIDKKAFITSVEGGVWLDVEKIN